MTTTRFGKRNTYSGFELPLSGQAVDVVEVGRVAATALWVARTQLVRNRTQQPAAVGRTWDYRVRWLGVRDDFRNWLIRAA